MYWDSRGEMPGSSNVWSRGQVHIFVKSHCTGVDLVEG